jgi:LacI family transcriptional regulator
VVEEQTAGLPVVYIEREQAGATYGAIRIDVEAGVHAAITHLVATGRRHIAMVDHERPEPSRRQASFHAALAAHGRTGRVVRGHQSFEGGRDALDTVLSDGGPLDGLLAYNDVIGIGALRRARALGIDVPGELAVIGFDGLALGELVEPPLTSVRIDTRRLGTMAVEQVARMLDGEPSEVATLTGELLLRGSA